MSNDIRINLSPETKRSIQLAAVMHEMPEARVAAAMLDFVKLRLEQDDSRLEKHLVQAAKDYAALKQERYANRSQAAKTAL